MSTPRFMLRAAVMLGRSLLSCAPAPHTLCYIHGFARIEIAQERRCFVVPLISRRAISNQILLILLILSKTSTRSTCSTRPSPLRTLRPCASALNPQHVPHGNQHPSPLHALHVLHGSNQRTPSGQPSRTARAAPTCGTIPPPSRR